MFRNASKSLTTSDEVYEYALSLLDRREHGEKELVQKLKRRCSSSELIRETVAKLKEYDLLNEERYARHVFESWRARKVYGRLRLGAIKNMTARRKKAWRHWRGISLPEGSALP